MIMTIIHHLQMSNDVVYKNSDQEKKTFNAFVDDVTFMLFSRFIEFSISITYNSNFSFDFQFWFLRSMKHHNVFSKINMFIDAKQQIFQRFERLIVDRKKKNLINDWKNELVKKNHVDETKNETKKERNCEMKMMKPALKFD